MPGAVASFRAEPASVREARRRIGLELDRLGFGDVVTTAELLVSELVTNAILHARSAIRLLVEVRGEIVHIGVRDESPRLPQQQRRSAEAGTGRGLWLVDKLATRWGVDREGGGKVVWFELPRHPATDDGWEDLWEA